MKNKNNIYFASSNKNKLSEVLYFQKEFTLSQLLILSLDDLSLDKMKLYNPKETSNSFFGNAYIKAKELHNIIGLPILSEDSGLCVEGLDGEPGIHSARLSGSDKTSNEIILSRLKKKLNLSRKACYFSCFCFLAPLCNPLFFIGKVYGTISFEPKGTKGFGYDPIFYYDGEEFTGTFGEISYEEKQKVSHRSKALEYFFAFYSNFYTAPL